jgi:ABC transporter substrate binding protein (PQQ-dependent alcohol dehydrogenase system)
MHLVLPCLRCLCVASLLVCTSGFAKTWRIALLEWPNNPQLDRSHVERAYLGHALGSVRDAVQMSIGDAQVELGVANQALAMDTLTANDEKAAIAQASKAEKAGAHFILADVPAAWLPALAASVNVPVINVSASADSLREKACHKNLLHTIPSERMRADAMAQSMVARKWKQVLVLTGPTEADAARSLAVTGAIKRYGLSLVAQKPFKISSDPRERNMANPLLLSAGLTYDAVWVVDSEGEFARNLPYNTSLPRPVVGDAGLAALAWHPQYERNGALQLSKRFFKLAKRSMAPQDWAAWVATKSIVTWAAQGSATNAPTAARLQALEIDGYKGVSLQYRSWDRQLRQPLLLTDGQGIVDTAPQAGIMHAKNVLDTLGADEAEKLCASKP